MSNDLKQRLDTRERVASRLLGGPTGETDPKMAACVITNKTARRILREAALKSRDICEQRGQKIPKHLRAVLKEIGEPERVKHKLTYYPWQPVALTAIALFLIIVPYFLDSSTKSSSESMNPPFPVAPLPLESPWQGNRMPMPAFAANSGHTYILNLPPPPSSVLR